MKAAFYEQDITPPLGLFLPGHGRRLYASDVYEHLYVKAVAIEAHGEVAILIVADTLEVPSDAHDIITKRIQEFTEIPPERICITATHTHWGAPIMDASDFHQSANCAYREIFYMLAADAGILAYNRLKEASVKFGAGKVEGISFNRDYVMEDGRVITYGKNGLKVKEMFGPTDPSLPILIFEHNGTPIGAIINFACHQCCGDHTAYTGDYSSILSIELKKYFGEDFVSIYVPGTCGDINHLNTDHSVVWPYFHYRDMGKKIAAEAIRVIENASSAGDDIAVIKEQIHIPVRTVDFEYTKKRILELLGSDDYYKNINDPLLRVRSLVNYYTVNTKTQQTLWLQVFRVGNVGIYFFPGEIFVKFGLKIKELSPFPNNIVVELSNSELGYVPTPEAFAPNCDLYEVTPTLKGNLIPEGGSLMVERLLAMANKIKKNTPE